MDAFKFLMLEAQDIFNLFEGQSPEGNEAIITHICGTQEWLDMHCWTVEGVTPTAWRPRPGRYAQGEVTFTDVVTGRDYCIGQNESGDWQ